MGKTKKNIIVPWDDIPQKLRQTLSDLSVVAEMFVIWECRNVIRKNDLQKITPLVEEYNSLEYGKGEDEGGKEQRRIIEQLGEIFCEIQIRELYN
jgi:hypothetical protein